MRGTWAAGFLALWMLLLPFMTIGRAEEAESPAVFRADELVVDQELGIVVATGNVEIAQDGRVLMADTITFNQHANTVAASGNVIILEPTGEVMFGEFVELTNDMRQGIIREFRMVLSDGSRFAANSAGRSGGWRTDLYKSVYSPCKLCPDNPERAPLWQLKAFRVRHDQKFQDIEYRDVFLEIFGVPVAYSPYFSHPDPSMARRSGFLVPVYASESALGNTLQIPFYWVLTPYRDITIEPIFTTREGVVFAGEYRERTANGQFDFDASVTRVDKRDDAGGRVGKKENRGHIFGNALFDLDQTWRTGFNLERASDDTYLKRYNFSSVDTLTTRLFAEGFRERNYFAANSYFFQGLREEDKQSDTPIILPLIDFNHHGVPNSRGSRWGLDANLMILTRTRGVDSRRISLGGTIEHPYYTRAGAIFTFSADLRGDLYWIIDQPRGDASGASTDGVTGRIFPQAALSLRYPLVRSVKTTRQVIEPLATFVASPFGGNPNRIPNEDSQAVEVNDTNVLNLNRFPGLDRVEGGPRFLYGVKVGVYGESGGYTSGFMGQSYRFRKDENFEAGSGLDDRRSDYVGRLNLVPARYVDLNYRFRLDKSDLEFRSNEAGLTVGPQWLRLNVEYLRLLDALDDTGVVGEREEISGSARLEITRNWSLRANGIRNLTDEGTVDLGGGLDYEDECVIFTINATRRFTRDRDVAPDTSVTVFINLKNLG